MSNICVIGTGYVGLVAIASFAELGHTVIGLDRDKAKIEALQHGHVPFFEPGLSEMLAKPDNQARISFTVDYAEALREQDFVFICVNTPPTRKGRPQMNQITSAARAVAQHITGNTVVVNKSTGPVGMADMITRILAEHGHSQHERPVVANPEFLSEGRAVHDFLHPHQVVIGSHNQTAAAAVERLYEPLQAPVATVGPRAAEMTKLASNGFRAVKVSFANELATVCETLEVDVSEVTRLLGADKAIGPFFLSAGIGWGGNCLPKDVVTLEHVAKTNGVNPRLLHAARAVNAAQRTAIIAKAQRLAGPLQGKKAAVLGLAFKGGTDDVRQSQAVGTVELLLGAGAKVSVHDPLALPNARKILGDRVAYHEDPYQAAADADVLLLLTDCPEYAELDLDILASLVGHPNLVDGRNFFNPADAARAGFAYAGVGRGYAAAPAVPEATHMQEAAA